LNTGEEIFNRLSDISYIQMKKYPFLTDNQLYLKFKVKSVNFSHFFLAICLKKQSYHGFKMWNENVIALYFKMTVKNLHSSSFPQ